TPETQRPRDPYNVCVWEYLLVLLKNTTPDPYIGTERLREWWIKEEIKGRENEFVLVRGCAVLPSHAPTHCQREIEERRITFPRVNAAWVISEPGSQLSVISICPARSAPSTFTIPSPTSCIDFRLTGVVITSVDVAPLRAGEASAAYKAPAFSHE
ncbi:Gamma-tubulin complex component 2 like, partial [Dissostichus eleginoides]